MIFREDNQYCFIKRRRIKDTDTLLDFIEELDVYEEITTGRRYMVLEIGYF